MKVSFNGVLENVATFETSGEVTVGSVVMMGGNGTVKACTDKAVFCGVLLAEKDGLASVQLAGYAKVPYTGSVSVGYQALVEMCIRDSFLECLVSLYITFQFKL